jgi:ferredoxin hydrogenase large subunit
MSVFNHDARLFKFEVLTEVSNRAYKETLNEKTPDEVAEKFIYDSLDNFRKDRSTEKEIIRRRTKLAMGIDPNGENNHKDRQIVRVINTACDECVPYKIRVTDNCRKCMAKSCIAACKFDAIKMGEFSSVIDNDKCKECGMCVTACAYNAIVKTGRPCMNSCPVDAITYNAKHVALIDDEKCINCGQCVAVCPFGAISDTSMMTNVISEIIEGQKVYATFAPAIQGQLNATLPQIKTALIKLGFNKGLEVAVGADAVTYAEHQELVENMEKGISMTTSCCPAFLNLARQYYPKVYKEKMSTTVSPMVAIARYLKAEDPDAKVVFIGPCIAKKQEAKELESYVDYVLSVEEVTAMFVSRGIDPSMQIDDPSAYPSIYGRMFAQGGGVGASVVRIHQEEGYENKVDAMYSDGIKECKKNLQMMNLNRLNIDILEGMSCVGGCINGPVNIIEARTSKMRMNKENRLADNKDIIESLAIFDFSNIDMHRHY